MAVEIKSVSLVCVFCSVYVYVFMCASVYVVCVLVLKCQTGEGQETVDAREWHMNKRFTGKREIQNYNVCVCVYICPCSHTCATYSLPVS